MAHPLKKIDHKNLDKEFGMKDRALSIVILIVAIECTYKTQGTYKK